MIKIKNTWISAFILMGASLMFSNSCKKEDNKNTTQEPIIKTTPVSDITQTSATSGGSITNDGGATITDRGVCWGTKQTPSIADNKISDSAGTRSFTINIKGLIPKTTYYIRAYGTYSGGTVYGEIYMFKTLTDATLPIVSTNSAIIITTTSATCGGNITSNGKDSIIALGVCWSTHQDPTTSDSKTIDSIRMGEYTSIITVLNMNTTYYYRAYATNSVGTSYGNSLSLTTTSTITDFDGNIYNTIIIGKQQWIQENLKVTHYNNGDAIPKVETTSWDTMVSGAFCNYDNIDSNANVYGHLYNFYALTDTRNICPAGWHIPTKNDFDTLIKFLGGSKVAGGKLKESGYSHWWEPNTGATNNSCFTALPGGSNVESLVFCCINNYARFWTRSTDWPYAIGLQLSYYNNEAQEMDFDFNYGLSVRCIKDN